MELQKTGNDFQKEIILGKIPGLPTGYQTILNQFDAWRIQESKSLDFETVKEFLSLPKQKGNGEYSPASLMLRKRILSASLKKATEDLRVIFSIDKNFKEIKNFRLEKTVHLEEILSKQEINKLIKDTKNIEARNWGERFGNKRERYSLIIETLASSGLRISELTGIKLKDCNTQNGFTYIRVIGKGAKPRRIFLPENLFKRIKKAFNSKEFLFLSLRGKRMNRAMIYQDIKDLGIRILNREIHPHTFRHSFATREIKKRGSVKAVSKYLGHSTTSITEDMYNQDEILPDEIFK